MPGRWGCPVCGAVYGAELHAGCPRHPGTPLEEEGSMAKITVASGPSNPDAEPGQPGYVEPAEETPAEPAARRVRRKSSGGDVETEEESSPGSRQQTSTEKPPNSQPTNDDDPPPPAPTTGSPSTRGRTGSSSASTTAGSGSRAGRSEK